MTPQQVLAILVLTVHTQRSAAERSQVMLVSMDGFRYDYLDKTDTPYFDNMRREGVTMPHMKNVFATSTFPSHYTMATGLYTESHGIIANRMYDPEFKAVFTKGNTETRWWEGGEPVWISVVKAGLKAGVFFWPGSEAEIQGHRPTEWRRYDREISFTDRVNTALTWLEQGFDLVMVYFHQPDKSGHKLGPESPEMFPVLQMMDGVLGSIRDQLKERGLEDSVNLLVTSDHGMTTISPQRVIFLDQLANQSLVQDVVTFGAYSHIVPQPGQSVALRDALVAGGGQHWQVWRKDDIPERLHTKHNRRMTEVFALADEGWSIVPSKKYNNTDRGNHGYDNYRQNMKPFFQAVGPAFKSSSTVDPISSLDLYPLICCLLGVTPAPNNGSLTRAATLLKDVENFDKCQQQSGENYEIEETDHDVTTASDAAILISPKMTILFTFVAVALKWNSFV